jgi:hypothetical protein
VGVVEIGRVDGYRLDNAFGLDTANAREIFHAVTGAEDAEPELLTKLFPEPQLGARGWFLDAIESDTLVTTKLASCQSANFVSSFEAWNPDINDGNWTQSDPFAAGGCAYSGLPCMYEWESTPGNYWKTQVDLAWKFDEYSIGYAWNTKAGRPRGTIGWCHDETRSGVWTAILPDPQPG